MSRSCTSACLRFKQDDRLLHVHLLTNLLPRAARLLGFPAGVGALIDHRTRQRLVLSGVLSTLLALLDMLGVLAMLPMLQYITGQSVDSGALGVVNSMLGEPSLSVLVAAMAALIVGAFIVKDVCALFVRRWQLRFMAHQQVDISAGLLESFLTSPYAWHLRDNTSDKLWTVTGAVSQGYVGGISAALSALSETLTITFIFASLLVISPAAALAAAAYFGIAAWVIQAVIRPRITAAGKRTREASQLMSKTSLEGLTAVKEIKLRRAHEGFVEAFRNSSRANADAQVQAGVLNQIPQYFLEIVFILGVGLLAVGAAIGAEGQQGLVLLGLFVAAGTRILPSSIRLINALGGIRYARSPLAHMTQVHHVLAETRAEELAAVQASANPEGDIRVNDVRFAYSDALDVDVLRGATVIIPEGTTLAVVGGSGAGKSTLVDVLLGLLRPTSGTITAGGVSIYDNLPAWQDRIAAVPQDVTLLDVSIADNIAFDEVPDPERLESAVQRAQLTDLIASLPDGLDTQAGERGKRLSGGQRQRVGIARALYRNPSVLILDEATSALDNETERRFTETIDGLKGMMTMIVVAHRLSTVRHCDSLIFMEAGRVATQGSFEEVRSRNAEFAHLVALGSLSASSDREDTEVGA